MLVRIYGKNFRSLKGKFELSMMAADFTNEKESNRGVFDVPISGMDEPLRLLRVAAIYGPNASGKSTVLFAGRALNWLAVHSSSRANVGGRIPPYEPFALDDESRTSPISLGCDVVHEDSILRYEISYRAKAIDTERLMQLNGNQEFVLFDRQKSGAVTGDLIEISEANRLYVKEMQPNVTVLAKLAQHGPAKGTESVQPYFTSIRAALQYEDYAPAAASRKIGDQSQERFASDSNYRDWIMEHLMRKADVGICDVNTSKDEIDIPKPLRELISQIDPQDGKPIFPETVINVSFIHSGVSNHAIEYSDESTGTKKLFYLADDWWRLANERVTLLADEIGASLHPRLLDGLIRAINDPPTDEVRSQLIFATHETGLLEGRDGLPPALRRDQVYFTNKDQNGGSELYSLAEFKDEARTVHNIRKRYISGLYRAMPSVEGLSL